MFLHMILFVVCSKSFKTFEIAHQVNILAMLDKLCCLVVPNDHSFCRVILLWLVIPIELFVHVHVECVLRYLRWLIFISSILLIILNIASNLGKHLQRLMKWWKTLMVISAWDVHIVMNGLRDLRMVGSQHMSRVLGRTSTSCDNAHMAQVREIVRSNCHLTVREIVEEYKISIGSSHEILTTKLEMHQVISKFVPQLLTASERQLHCHLSGTSGLH
jgi:hypothetical protein